MMKGREKGKEDTWISDFTPLGFTPFTVKNSGGNHQGNFHSSKVQPKELTLSFIMKELT